jgi:hypothetical protein
MIMTNEALRILRAHGIAPVQHRAPVMRYTVVTYFADGARCGALAHFPTKAAARACACAGARTSKGWSDLVAFGGDISSPLESVDADGKWVRP